MVIRIDTSTNTISLTQNPPSLTKVLQSNLFREASTATTVISDGGVGIEEEVDDEEEDAEQVAMKDRFRKVFEKYVHCLVESLKQQDAFILHACARSGTFVLFFRSLCRTSADMLRLAAQIEPWSQLDKECAAKIDAEIGKIGQKSKGLGISVEEPNEVENHRIECVNRVFLNHVTQCLNYLKHLLVPDLHKTIAWSPTYYEFLQTLSVNAQTLTPLIFRKSEDITQFERMKTQRLFNEMENMRKKVVAERDAQQKKEKAPKGCCAIL